MILSQSNLYKCSFVTFRTIVYLKFELKNAKNIEINFIANGGKCKRSNALEKG